MSSVTYREPFLTIAQTVGVATYVKDPDSPLVLLVEDPDTKAVRATMTFTTNSHGRIDHLAITAADGTGLIELSGLHVSKAQVNALFTALGTNLATGYPNLVGLVDDNTLVHGSSGSDNLESRAGDDTVLAGGGNDHIYEWAPGDLKPNGGDGSDTLIFHSQTAQPPPIPSAGR